MAKTPTRKPASTTQGGQEAPARTATHEETKAERDAEAAAKDAADAERRAAKQAEQDAKNDPDAIDAIQKGLEVRGY